MADPDDIECPRCGLVQTPLTPDPTQGASTIAYAALAAIESGETQVRLVNPLSDERLTAIESEALLGERGGRVLVESDELLLMIAEIRKGRTAR